MGKCLVKILAPKTCCRQFCSQILQCFNHTPGHKTARVSFRIHARVVARETALKARALGSGAADRPSAQPATSSADLSSSVLAAASLQLHPQRLTLLDPPPGHSPSVASPWHQNNRRVCPPGPGHTLPSHSQLSPLPASEPWELRDPASLIFISQYLPYTWHLVGHQPVLLKTKCRQCCKHLLRENPSTS